MYIYIYTFIRCIYRYTSVRASSACDVLLVWFPHSQGAHGISSRGSIPWCFHWLRKAEGRPGPGHCEDMKSNPNPNPKNA